MDIADFKTNRFTFELRFPEAHILWDRAGAITTALKHDLPGLEVVDGTPAKVSLSLKPNVEMVLELGKAFIIVHHPKRNAEDLITYSEVLTRNLIEILGIHLFNRVGTRLIYQKDYASINDATAQLVSFGMVSLPTCKFFNQQGAPKQGGISFSWEGEAIGVRVRLATETERLEFSPSPPHSGRLEPVNKTEHLLYADVDIFSVKDVLKEQLKVDDWIKNAVHMSNRDLKHFLGGA